MSKEIIYQQFAWKNILRFVVSFFYVTLSISPSSQAQSCPSPPLLPSSPLISFPVISSHLLFPATFTSLLFSSFRPCSVLISSILYCALLILSLFISSNYLTFILTILLIPESVLPGPWSSLSDSQLQAAIVAVFAVVVPAL